MPLEYNAGMQAVLELCICATAVIAVVVTGFVFLTLVHLAQTISLIAIDSQLLYHIVQLQWNVSLVISTIWTISLDKFLVVDVYGHYVKIFRTRHGHMQLCGVNSCGY